MTAEKIAEDLDTQLVMFKDKPFLVEPFKQTRERTANVLGSIFAEELATSLSRRGYIILKDQVTDVRGRARPDFSLESAEVLVGGTYFTTPKRLSFNVQAIEPRSNLIIATSSASVLRTEEVDHLIKTSNRKNLITFERVPIGLLGF